jgi:hypothetical protein
MFARKEPKQFEFFEEFSESPTTKFKRLRLPTIDKEKIIIKISYEGIVFVVIGFILILSLVFSLGVERGKSQKIIKLQPQPPAEVKTPEKKETQLQGKKAGSTKIIKTKGKTLKNEFYTIQVVAYKNLTLAFKEKEKIKKLGLTPFIIKGKKGYFLVGAGNFDDLSKAKEKLMSLKKIYGDCFIKKIKKEDLYGE